MRKQNTHTHLAPFLEQYNNLIESLELFGLTERESSIYLTILLNGEMSAGSLSKELKLHRLDAYNALKLLQEREMLEVSLSRPMLFRAVPLEGVLDLLSLKHREKQQLERIALAYVEEASKKLDRRLLEEKRESSENSDRLRILSGRKAIKEKWSGLLSSAKNEILIAATERETARMLLSNVLDVISRKIKAGIKVNVYTPVTMSNKEQLLDFKEQIRHLTVSSSAGLCIIDRRQAMMVLLPTSGQSSTSRSSKEETAVLIDSRSIGEILGTLFFVGWDTSPLVQDVVDSINPHS